MGLVRVREGLGPHYFFVIATAFFSPLPSSICLGLSTT